MCSLRAFLAEKLGPVRPKIPAYFLAATAHSLQVPSLQLGLVQKHLLSAEMVWQDVCRALGVDLTGQTSASYNMRLNYEKCLLDFEAYLISGNFIIDTAAGRAPSADMVTAFAPTDAPLPSTGCACNPWPLAFFTIPLYNLAVIPRTSSYCVGDSSGAQISQALC